MTILDLLDSVRKKRSNLQQLKLKLKLYSVWVNQVRLISYNYSDTCMWILHVFNTCFPWFPWFVWICGSSVQKELQTAHLLIWGLAQSLSDEVNFSLISTNILALNKYTKWNLYHAMQHIEFTIQQKQYGKLKLFNPWVGKELANPDGLKRSCQSMSCNYWYYWKAYLQSNSSSQRRPLS